MKWLRVVLLIPSFLLLAILLMVTMIYETLDDEEKADDTFSKACKIHAVFEAL